MPQNNPICVALDTPDVAKARALARAVKSHVGMLKIGLEFFYANGAAGYEAVAAEGVPIFLDLKLHDIPNTVAQGLTSLLKLSPAPVITNIHAGGGLDMMKAAKDAVGDKVKLIAVTILTSLSDENIWAAGFDTRKTDEHALNLAKLTHQAGLDGVVCSPLDLAAIRKELPRDFLTVVPGIRLADAATHDQKRVATPKAAVEAGANVLVIGRAITGATDPAKAAADIFASLK
ncbi:orotidine-5'-phosphate decarboxylase [Aestuariivirga litoralis]|uniref:orotidine-5'-phosphate decarboxylase n=1 Tax=Aestuariivirga litoralis TaxID=2650924 RepID=UPI0018C80328|nr:orotidine-5'-phosphate decarboxylase [Aestuariivirga litoralis]MBG1233941.1 orotidine-5'-phosphate decarboxylase [Aestuariivirga litoralis]